MPEEVPTTLRLYLDGKTDQFCRREVVDGVVFVMTTESFEEAGVLLKALPIGQANLLKFERSPIVPLIPLEMLLDDAPPIA